MALALNMNPEKKFWPEKLLTRENLDWALDGIIAKATTASRTRV